MFNKSKKFLPVVSKNIIFDTTCSVSQSIVSVIMTDSISHSHGCIKFCYKRHLNQVSILDHVTVWTEYIQTKYTNPPCQPPPHRTPHHLQSRWKTSFSALAAAAEAAGELWPSLAFSRATDPEENAPLWTKIFRLIAILESNWRWSACWDLSRVCRRNPA